MQMKKYSLTVLLGGTLLAATFPVASAYTLRQFTATPEARIMMPAAPDSLEKENPFSASKLLEARPRNAAATELYTIRTEADTAGFISFEADTVSPLLRSFRTRIRAERFAKGKLLLTSTSRGLVRNSEGALITKNDADSLPGVAEASFTMLPEADCDLLVDILSMPDDKSAPQFKLEFIPDSDFEDVTVTADPMMSRRVAPVTTMTGERANRATLSADGKYLLILYREVLSASETLYRSSVVETATGKVISENIGNNPSWLPTGSTLYYTLERDGKYDLYLMDVPSMRTRLMARSLPDSKLTFSPDGRYLFYYTSVEGAKDTGVMRRLKNPDDRIPGDRDRSYITRYDLQTHIAQPLTYGGSATYMLDFSADGKKMLYMSQRQTPSRFPFYESSLVEMNLLTLRTDTIINDPDGQIVSAVYSPDAKRLFVVGGPDSFGGIGANYSPEPVANPYDYQGYVLDLATGRARAYTRDFTPAVQADAVWNRIDGQIYFLGEDGFFQNLYTLNPESGKISPLSADSPYIYRFSMGDNESRWLSYVGGSFTDDGSVGLIDIRSGKCRTVASPLSESLTDTRFGEMKPWKFTAADGTVVDGYECLPPDFNPAKKYPLIVYYYGGTSPSNATFYHLYSPQVFASRDYVVYVLNPSGTTGYGQEFAARHVNAWGRRTADEIIEGTKKFCQEHPYVDSSKIGCIGASYGGFMTQYLQTKTDIFAAAVSHAGISNVTSYWGEGYWGYSYNSIAAARHYPWNDPELYTRQGSLFNADKIHTPLLLLHGSVDTNVPIGESIQLFNALRILGRDVEFITVDGENHVIQNFDKKILWQNTIMAWFAKYLQNDSRWWDELYGK